MNTYSCTFRGRENGSIGSIHLGFCVVVNAENEKEAELKLYDTHEHISLLSIQQVNKNFSQYA